MDVIFRVPATLQADLDRFREETQRFKSGEVSPVEYRSFRVPQGVYEQRQEGTFMLRVRLPAGAILPQQMRALAVVARKYGSGRLHVTTRQDIQIHDVLLDGIHPALAALYAEAGLSTKGGGGNTVRNVIACPDAGVCAREAFDVSPHTVAVTEFLFQDPVSFQLPRKFKLAFAGCSADCVGATVNDVGFVAKRGLDGPGFTVYAGGGMGAHSRVADLLEEFVPAKEIHHVAEAIKRVFDKHGNRRNKHKARLRFLIEEKGLENFVRLYREELARIRQSAAEHTGDGSLPLRPLPIQCQLDPGTRCEPLEGFEVWRTRNVLAQKQTGYFLVHIPVFLGDISADTFEKLADVAEEYGEGMLRATPSQNLVIRWVPEAALAGLHRKLSALELAAALPPVSREMVACTGAGTCKLGICLSQGLARAIRNALERAALNLHDAVDLRLHINGCPNSCGRHALGSIGLFGAARREDDRLLPHYVLQLGGRVGAGRATLAQGKETLPARSVPAYLVELLRVFRESEQYPDFDRFLKSGGREAAMRIAAPFKHVPRFTEDRNYYYDWGAEEPFSLAGRGPGECSAGVFDLIQVDLASARQAYDEKRLLPAVVLAARALLITRGEEAKNAADALVLFEKHFIDTGLVDGTFRKLMHAAREGVAALPVHGELPVDRRAIADLIAAVENLYQSMDQSLRFQPAGITPEKGGADGQEPIKVDREADLQGVTCPLNYVKTKLLLQSMRPGQILAVLLDEAGGRSVPESAAKDGHEVLRKQKAGDQWQVIIRKR